MNQLKKKVGPLPVWAWTAAVILGVAIYYIRKGSSGPSLTGTAATTAAGPLDPTEGGFPMPSGISSGGVSPELPTPLTAQDIAGAVSQELGPLFATLPYASAPGEPQDPSIGADPIQTTVDTIKTLQDAGLVAPRPASTGAATSKPQKHTKPKKHVTERAKRPAPKVVAPVAKQEKVNEQKGNPRQGQTYRVVVNPKGHPKGTYHVYGKKRYVRVKR